MSQTRRSRRRLRPAAAACLTITLLASGCSSGATGDRTATPTRPAADSGPVAVQPGGPGEPSTTVDAGAHSPADDWNHADVAFVQMMIPHHAQALQMARLARTRAGSPGVRRLAARIHAAQGPEILTMAQWLADRDMEVPRAAADPMSYDHRQHGHDGMAGMLTPAQMRSLARARGTRFDRLFLTGMISHHQGALTMVDNVATTGVDLRVGELAADVSAGQTAEISRMRSLHREL